MAKESSLSNKIKKILEFLNKDVYEKEEIFALSLLALLSGESIFLIGNPGVAKSLIARRIKNVLKTDTSSETKNQIKQDNIEFEYLMNKFSTPEEIFGPIDIYELEKGNYVRKTQGYLPTAYVAFLDEIWKAGPAIQNTLLTIINERIYKNGVETFNVPLKLLISASNEFPSGGQGLEALYDRFIIRYEVLQIQQSSNFEKLINIKTKNEIEIDDKSKFSIKEIDQHIQNIELIKIEGKPLEFIEKLKVKLEKISKELMSVNERSNGIYISDRRWTKVAFLVKSSAYYNGRKEVGYQDLPILTHTLWSNFEDREIINHEFNELLSEVISIEEIEHEIRQIESYLNGYDTRYFKTVQTPEIKDKIVSINKIEYFEYEVDNDPKKYFIEKSVIESASKDKSLSHEFFVGERQNDVEKVMKTFKVKTKSKKNIIEFSDDSIAERNTIIEYTESKEIDNGYSIEKEKDLARVEKNINEVYDEIEENINDINGPDNIFLSASFKKIVRHAFKQCEMMLAELTKVVEHKIAILNLSKHEQKINN